MCALEKSQGDLAVQVEAAIIEAKVHAIERAQAFAGDPRDHLAVPVADGQVQVAFEGREVDAFGETQAGEDSLPQVFVRRDALRRSVASRRRSALAIGTSPASPVRVRA